MQDVVAGDGTTSVVVICGALLKKAQELLEKGIHPTVISDSFNKAACKACEVGKLLCLSPVARMTPQYHENAKMVSSHSHWLVRQAWQGVA